MTDGPGRNGGIDQLDEQLRALHADTDDLILAESTSVRRRGDRRSRTVRAGTVLGVAVLTVGVVGITSALTHRQTAAPPATPTPTVTELRLSLADSPFLQRGDIRSIGEYSGFTEGGEQSGTSAGNVCLANPGRWGASNWRSTNFTGDLDATFVETVLAFPDAAAARAAAERPAADFVNEPRVGMCSSTVDPAAGTYSDRSPEALSAGDQAYRLSRLLTPSEDAGLEYHEVAVGRKGTIVVVLDWVSLGQPTGGDGWAFTDTLVAAALDRAIAP